MSRPADHTLELLRQGATLAEDHLQALASRLPALQRALVQHGTQALGDYVRGLSRAAPGTSLQDPADLASCVHRRCAAMLGDQVAHKAAEELSTTARVLTANHHGVDYFAQSLQGTLSLALDARERDGAVVVLACGAIPINNLTYPRGILSYQHCNEGATCGPLRLPVYPDRYKRSMVCTTPAMDAPMLRRARKRIDTLRCSGDLSDMAARVMDDILHQDYSCTEVLQCDSYSQQATLLNHRLWQRLFADPTCAPPLAYLEMESITAELLMGDLSTDSSLASSVLFDGSLREQVLWQLDGERACWNRAALARRNLATGTGRSAAGATGTVFFWGLDARRRRVPLALTTGYGGVPHLQGVADDGEFLRVPFNPAGVSQALRERRLLPSLFVSYLTIAMARGISCLGGYYQAEYLPVMHKAVVDALQGLPECRNAARAVSGTVCDAYLSGMQAVCTINRNGGLIPAGPLEIIAGGGLQEQELQTMSRLRVYDAHLASIVDTLMDAGADLVNDEAWHLKLDRELAATLGGKVVIKNE